MQSRNPVLRRATQQASGVDLGSPSVPTPSAEELDSIFGLRSAADGRLTVDDVIVKTGLCFVVLLVGAVAGWSFVVTMPWLLFAAAIAGFGLAMANIFMKKVNPVLVLAYSLAQGLMLGAVSYMYNDMALANNYHGIVQQAVVGTLVTFGVMLAMYKMNIIKVSSRTRRMFMVALMSYVVIGLISLVAAIFGVGGGLGFYGVGGFGIAICAIGAGLAAFSLVIDFDAIAQTVKIGAPEHESWRLAFGLLVTLIWLYLELLRLIALLSRR
ncbi:MAG: Bax inhibitor-1/YccA family protein [Actinomycetes bacterium]|jgi:uncharacterized YccA/Bax inhibitor family protein